jgi:hypothetical protein
MVPPGIDPTKLTVTISWPGTAPSGNHCGTQDGDNSPPCVVNVQVSYSFNCLLLFVPVNAFTLTGKSSERIAE